MVLSLDIETYSSVNLKKSGVYAYAQAPDFAILLIAYAFGDGEVEIIDVAQGEKVPSTVIHALEDSAIRKQAFNANFERVCLSKHFQKKLPTNQWDCTMVHARMLGLGGGLGNIAKHINIQEQKDQAGAALINYFTKPCRPTKVNGGRTRNLPFHDVEKWEAFKAYCIQDVKTEMAVKHKLSKHYTIPDKERHLYALDQKINDLGIKADLTFIENAVYLGKKHQNLLEEHVRNMTGIENPRSPQQVKAWFLEHEGVFVKSIAKDKLPALREKVTSPVAKELIDKQSEIGRIATKKYQVMLDCEVEGRINGTYEYYGASRTGRWAGRRVQTQNLPRNSLQDLDAARQSVMWKDYSLFHMLWEDPTDILTQLIRTAFVPKEGHKFIVSDFSAIEARILSWLADERWRMDVFASHGKIYEASASQMFSVPLEDITRDSPLRDKGKVAELALGYGGGTSAMKRFGADRMGMTDEEMQSTVDLWRRTNPEIVKFWRIVNDAALQAVREKTTIPIQKNIRFIYEAGVLFIQLPSGRRLSYPSPQIGKNRWGWDAVEFLKPVKNGKEYIYEETYGGKLTENITQAIARDCLAESMLRLDGAGFQIVMHVHDEVVIEEPITGRTVQAVEDMMSLPLSWAEGLILTAEGFETEYYKKD